MKPSFSIIIPCRNKKNTISSTLNSLKKLDYPSKKFEIIVVDSSEDGTEKILKKFKGKKIRIFTNSVRDRRNSNISRNIGAKHARFENLIFLDADCVAEKNFLKEYSNFCNYDLVGGNLEIGGKNFFSNYFNNSFRSVKKNFEKRNEITLKNFHKGKLPVGGNFFIKKKILQNVGLFDENTPSFDEIELFFRVVRKGYKILTIPTANVKTMYASKFSDIIKTYFRMGKGLGYFISKHSHSAYAKSRIFSFIILDFIAMSCLFLLSYNISLFLYAFVAFLFASFFWYRGFVYKKNSFQIFSFIFLDIFLLAIVYQFSALLFILKKILYE